MNVIVVLLAGAAALSFLLVDWVQRVAILAVIVINTAIGSFTELCAVHSIEALYRPGRVSARVRRDGKVRDAAADQLVAGDIVVVAGGDLVSADKSIVTASGDLALAFATACRRVRRQSDWLALTQTILFRYRAPSPRLCALSSEPNPPRTDRQPSSGAAASCHADPPTRHPLFASFASMLRRASLH